MWSRLFTVWVVGALLLPTLATGVVLALAYLLLASGFFVRVYRRAIRTGLMSRYSAESIS